MYTSVLDRFPDRSEQITQLLQEDADFQEMCADYEELATWLGTNVTEDGRSEAKCAEARQVLESLELEIIRKLESALGIAASKNTTTNSSSDSD